jgi:hypothetical protein
VDARTGFLYRPNPAFLHQLSIFHSAAFKVTSCDKATRMFYLERAVQEVTSACYPYPRFSSLFLALHDMTELILTCK